MKIYVAMHKIMELPINNKIYERILVGSYNKKSKDILRDDNGENISQKNENYCELTALYWIWKNSNEDIVGLCHYRRYLSKKNFSLNSKSILDESEINKSIHSENIDIILPKKHHYKGKVKNMFNIAPNNKDMEYVKKTIETIYPEYLESYEIFMNQSYAYLCNVFITKKEIFNEYCEWLFSLLFEIERIMPKEEYINDNYRKRMFGFLSERLLNIWIIYNKNYKIKEYPMINTEMKKNDIIKESIKDNLKKLITNIK